HDVPRRRRARERTAGRLVVPGRRAQDDPSRLADGAAARRLPQRRRPAHEDGTRRAGARRLLHRALQRRPRPDRLPAAAAAVREPLVARALDGRSERARGGVRGTRRGRARGALAAAVPPRDVSEPLRATYRLQLGPALSLARARALVPYLGSL